MEIDLALHVYYKQFDYNYDVKGKDKAVKSSKLKINLYLDPSSRNSKLVNLDSEIKLKEKEINDRINDQVPCKDDATSKRKLQYFRVQYDPVTHLIKSYTLDEKKVTKARKISGFFAITTVGVK